VIGNRVLQNGSIGILASGDTLVSKNVASSNALAEIDLFAPAKSLSDNLCDGAYC